MPSNTLENKILTAIDRQLKNNQEDPRRRHLGASIIGRRCIRQIWYSWRWFHPVRHEGRLLRLFERGHLEEFRFMNWLQLAGFQVRPFSQMLLLNSFGEYILRDWGQEVHDDEEMEVSSDIGHVVRAARQGVEPKQWHFSAGGGHFGGSSDGQIIAPEELSDQLPGVGGVEFKTHSDKSFKKLKDAGVLSAKLEHYVQMQVYMKAFSLQWCLYMAINKNDDDLYLEVVHANPEVGDRYFDVALKILNATDAPARISEDKSWWECKFCDYREICHYGKQPDKSCRTCPFASAVDGGDAQWRCTRFMSDIPADFEKNGCDQWEPIL